MRALKLLVLIVISSLVIEIFLGVISAAFGFEINFDNITMRAIIVLGPALIISLLILNKLESRKSGEDKKAS